MTYNVFGGTLNPTLLILLCEELSDIRAAIGEWQCLPALRRRQRTFAHTLAALHRLVATHNGPMKR